MLDSTRVEPSAELGVTQVPKLGVFYYWQRYNQINGSLLYAFEYFYQLLESCGHNCTPAVTLYIVCDPNDTKVKEKVLNLYNSKYKQEVIDKAISSIKFITRFDCYSLILDKVLFIDIKSYNEIYWLSPNSKKYLYCNNVKDMKLSIPYPITTLYGYYSYQKYNLNKRVPLKLKFDIFKEVDDPGSPSDSCPSPLWFVSSLGSTERDIKPHLPENYVYKTSTQARDIYNHYQNILYVHNGNLDTNNRLIPESKFYNKNLEVIFTKADYKDIGSITDRWNNDWKHYELDGNDLLITDILKDC